jgi:hypothetical protein
MISTQLSASCETHLHANQSRVLRNGMFCRQRTHKRLVGTQSGTVGKMHTFRRAACRSRGSIRSPGSICAGEAVAGALVVRSTGCSAGCAAGDKIDTRAARAPGPSTSHSLELHGLTICKRVSGVGGWGDWGGQEAHVMMMLL